MSDSVWPHRRQPTRLPRPWDSPGKNSGVGCWTHWLPSPVHESEKWKWSCSVVSESSRPTTNSLNFSVTIGQVFLFKLHACYDLAVGLLDFPLNFVQVKVFVAQLCPTLCDLMGCNLPGSSVRGILQARILEWVAMPSSRGSSWLREWTQVSCIGRRILYHLSQNPIMWCISKGEHRVLARVRS